MRFSAIIFCAAGLVLVGCATHRATDKTSASWLSGIEMESRLVPLARDYCKQHKIDFDFTGAHCRVQLYTGCDCGGSGICGSVFFDHGIGKLGFQMNIDHDGKIIQAWTVVPEVGIQPQPGG
jgi:hypothetical protein